MRFVSFFFQCLLTGSLFIVPVLSLKAQDSVTRVSVHIKVVEFGVNGVSNNSEPVFKFFLGKDETGKMLNSGGLCNHFETKGSIFTFALPDVKYPGQQPDLEIFTVPIRQRSSFSLAMECYEDDKGEICTYDKKDQLHSVTAVTYDLNNFVPGDFTDTMRIADSLNHFYCLIQLKYSLLPPGIILAEPGFESINAADKPIKLSFGYPLVNKDRLSFTWEYSIDGGSSWKRAGAPNPDDLSLSIAPLKDIFKDRLTTTEQVFFRCRVNSRVAEAISDTLVTYFTPPPPSCLKEDITIVPTCKTMSVGSITIKNLKSTTGKISYVLRRAINSNDSCLLNNPSDSSCPGFVRAGEAVNRIIELKKLPADSFTLILFNSGLSVGNVVTRYTLLVDTFPEFKSMTITQKNPTCFDFRAGEIAALVEGGASEEQWQVELDPIAGTMERKPGMVIFKNLQQADYFLQVTDGCGSVINKNVYLKKPDSLVIESIRKEKANGYIYTIKLKNGSGHYDVTISNKDQLQKKFDSSNLIIPFSLPGIWKIHIVDKSDPDCVWMDTTIRVVHVMLPSNTKSTRDNENTGKNDKDKRNYQDHASWAAIRKRPSCSLEETITHENRGRKPLPTSSNC